MKRFIFPFVLLMIFGQFANAQDSIQYRVILIGDAGERTVEQKAVMLDASQNVITGKTIALFLGDNIYPKGMELDGEEAVKASKDILRSQYEGLRKAGVPVYFVPGNHDWDKSGPSGYQKMIRANQFFRDQNDSLLQLIPKDACPGPYELVVSENLVVVAMDSEWWLYPFSKKAEGSDCECKTKRDILGKLNDIIQRNKNKIILFATHHPFNSNGSHGGYYNLKDHVFPLTNLSKGLYIPLPVIGSLYPLLRTTFPTPEDLNNVLYKDMKKNVEAVLVLHPNIIHVAGHEHVLQLIQGAVLELGSGAGSKYTPAGNSKGTIISKSASGYVIADILLDKSIRLTYRFYDQDRMQVLKTHTIPFKRIPDEVEKAAVAVNGDSINIRLNPAFDKVSKLHRSLFGENYRKVWAIETTVPVLRISAVSLVPKELGGGMQTHSLRLTDANKKEWVLRSIEKFPGNLLPQSLTNTLAADILRDNSTAAFPYAPLTVPVFADAAGVPHSNPTVVYIAPDKNLGIYSKDFANTISLFEEREPLGKSLSTIKMQDKLKDDNDNTVDQQAFLKARLLDIFLGDWDRHADQWRWIEEDHGKGKIYKPIPRDRDQVFYVNRGLLPGVAALPWIQPKFQGFSGRIKNINTFSFNARFIDGIFTNNLSYNDWVSNTEKIVRELNDSVIETALKRLPKNVYESTHLELADQLKKRRQDLQLKMPQFYRFLNKIIDIQTSDKNELVVIRDTLNGMLALNIYKISKDNETDKVLYSRVLDPSVTKEIRLFLQGGNDSVIITNNGAPVTIRIVGDAISSKKYDVNGGNKYLRKVHIYDGTANATFSGGYNKIHQHLSDDKSNTELQLTNRYNKTIPLVNAGFNVDDGFIFGGGIRMINQGFRKQPYASVQQFTLARSFSTNAFRFFYKGEWLNGVGKADFVLQAAALAPDNTQNFFGRGNESLINKSGDYKRFYRTRFSLYNLSPAFRWRSGKGNSITIGPALQYYRYSPDGNTGRFITNISLIHSYDSATIGRDKSHAGVVMNIIHDTRNNILLPTFGSYVNLRLQGYTGLNDYSKSFAQLVTEIAVFKSIDRKSAVVIADRLGGGVTTGKAAFYQSLFLGGHENLLGYHQYRFAGEHLFYNNLEARIRIANVASYLLPGQLGLVGFYDIGKVWQKGYNSDTWHQGVGGGIYFAPAQMAIFQLVAGHSKEGWYPYFTMGFRF
ncbi:MAG: metallophosphoesterase [Ferruginibacter sp.]|nr:metallophosphoesterase [Ferruginibacter sp.]